MGHALQVIHRGDAEESKVFLWGLGRFWLQNLYVAVATGLAALVLVVVVVVVY